MRQTQLSSAVLILLPFHSWQAFSTQVVAADCQEETLEPLYEVGLLQTSFIAHGQDDARSFASLLSSVVQQVHSSNAAVSSPHKAEVPTPAQVSTMEVRNVTVVRQSSAEDLTSLFCSLIANTACVLVCFGTFSMLRLKYKSIFQPFAEVEPAQEGNLEAPKGFLSWLKAATKLSIDNFALWCGLDHALFIAFLQFGLKLILVICVPQVVILMPVYLLAGGGNAGSDKLGLLGIANVAQNSWTLWMVVGAVWWVVAISRFMIFREMRLFLPRRTEWLKELPYPRCCTVLLEDLPESYRKASALRNFLNAKVFEGDVVERVNIVKDTSDLRPLVMELEDLRLQLERQATSERQASYKVNTQVFARMREAEGKVVNLRQIINGSEELNTSSAFVTFKRRTETNGALQIVKGSGVVHIELAPDPEDIIWPDLMVDPNAQAFRHFIGYMSIAGLFVGFLPLVILIITRTRLATVGQQLPFLAALAVSHPYFGYAWDGLVTSLALTTAVGFLPTLLVVIFSSCFVLKAQGYLQHKLQLWLFAFQVVFVLLLPAVGNSLIETLTSLFQDPFQVFNLLGTSELQTNFFLLYFPLQWSSVASDLTRYMVFTKFIFYRRLYGANRAKDLSEPESQDHSGLGARIARTTLVLVTTLVLCTISPLITIVGIIYFGISRIVYGWLFAFAEKRKPDLGGEFFVTALRQTLYCLFIYITVMTGILFQTTSSRIPALLALLSALFLLHSCYKFEHEFPWEHPEVFESWDIPPGPSQGDYLQPELQDDAAQEQQPEEHPDVLSETIKGFKTRMGTCA